MSILRSKLVQAVLVLGGTFLFFRFGIRPPAPWSVVKLYMTITFFAASKLMPFTTGMSAVMVAAIGLLSVAGLAVYDRFLVKESSRRSRPQPS